MNFFQEAPSAAGGFFGPFGIAAFFFFLATEEIAALRLTCRVNSFVFSVHAQVLFGQDAVFEKSECGGVHGLFEFCGDVFGETVDGETDAGGFLEHKFAQFFDVTQVRAATGKHDVKNLVLVTGIFDFFLDGVENLFLHAAIDDLGEVRLADLYGFLLGTGDGDEVVLVAFVDDAGPVFDFDLLGHLEGDLAQFRDVAGDDVAAEGDDLGVDGAAVDIDDEVGGAAADVHQCDAVFLLIFTEAGDAGGHGLQDDVFEICPRVVAAQANFVHLLLAPGDQLVDTHDGVAEFAGGGVCLPGVVDDVALGYHVDDLLTWGHGCLEDFCLEVVDLLVGNGDVVVAVTVDDMLVEVGLDVMAGDAHVGVLNLHVGMLLGDGLGLHNAVDRAVDVLDFSKFHAGRGCDAVSDDGNLSALFVAIADDGGYFGGADVESDDEVVVDVLHKGMLSVLGDDSVFEANVKLGVLVESLAGDALLVYMA